MRNIIRMLRHHKIVTACIIMILVSIMSVPYLTFNDHKYTVTVTDKDRVYTDKDKESKYLVFCDDDNGKSVVFENADKWIRFKFTSSDIQGQLKIGHRYEVTVIGIRLPIFSTYENIIKVKELQ